MKRGSAVLLGGITLLGALLRVWSPGRIGLWGDEVQFLNVSALPSYHAIIAFLYAHESHPPLLYLIAHTVGAFSSHGAAVLSLLMLAASVALIPAAWWLAALSGTRGAGAVAATLVAASAPIAVLSVELRPYALFSLLLLLSAGALVRAHRGGGWRWPAAWVVLALLLLYLHHLATLAVVAEVGAVLLLATRRDGWRAALGRWWLWLALVLLLALPDLVMLAHQARVTGYLPAPALHLTLPPRQFVRLGLTFPAELGLTVLASVALLLARPGSRALVIRKDAGILSGGIFLATCAMLVVAAYRQSVLVEHLVLPFAPLGQVATGIVLADAFATRQRWVAGTWAQGALACVALSAIFTVGLAKTNLDLVGRYVSAEAGTRDLVILVPGSLGAALERVLTPALSRIEYPVIGSSRTYEFDGNAIRILDPRPLGAALDSIDAAGREGRVVWLIVPAKWLGDTVVPGSVAPDTLGGAAQASRQRAGVLRRRLVERFGLPGVVVAPGLVSWSTEVVALERFAS